MTDRFVLDASALLAMLHRELGADVVSLVLQVGSISTVNWSEVIQKARLHGVDVDGLDNELAALGLEYLPFGRAEAFAAADMWRHGAGEFGLADRACLATAVVHGHSVVTADRAWRDIDLGVSVQLIR